VDRIGADVVREMRRFGPAGSIASVVEAWAAAVGDDVSRHAWPARMTRDRTLVVHTSSAAWAFELTHLAPVVLEQLHAALGGEAPVALRFVPGALPEHGVAADRAPAGGRPPAAVAPSAVSESEAARLTAGIEDQELRSRVARAAALGLEKARADRRF
jgi:hypothetical protein